MLKATSISFSLKFFDDTIPPQVKAGQKAGFDFFMVCFVLRLV